MTRPTKISDQTYPLCWMIVERPDYCTLYFMPEVSQTSLVLSFQSITDISKFKNECDCREFYIDRDALTLVGIFSDRQIELATTRYSAMITKEKE